MNKISKFQLIEIHRAAKAAHLRYLIGLSRPLHVDAPAEDARANAEWDAETDRLIAELQGLGRTLSRKDLMTHEHKVFDAELARLDRG